MSKTLLFETKSVLAEMRHLRKTIADSSRGFKRYESLCMANSFHKGSSKQQYYLRNKGTSKKKYLGTEETLIVRKIKAARYYKKLLKVIDRDIQLLEAVNRDYVLPDYEIVNSLLPKVYRSEQPPGTIRPSKAAEEWKKQKEAEKAKYTPYRPEDLTQMALDGTMMRSLSEVTIANYLLSLGITFVYELPMTHHGRTIWPDFTILSPVDNKTEIIIEHQGAMSDEKYQGKFIRTVLFYLSTNLVPNKDVFFTFNHLNRNLDLRQIDCILRIAFGFEAPPIPLLN